MTIPPTAPLSTPESLLAQLERTTDQIIGRADLLTRLCEGRPLRIKFGVDLTAPDLHLGHAVNLWMMRTLQDHGHTVIFLLGDTTSRIGDPTGRSAARPVLTEQQIRDNATSFLDQVSRVLRTDPELLEIRRNSEWFDEMGVAGLLAELSLVTHAHLISRDMFRSRIAAGTEIAMHELIYPVLQGFDSVALESDLTIVGTDQLFNEAMGRELQVKHGQTPQTIITSTVTPGLDGGPKQSKSLNNYVGLCACSGGEVRQADDSAGRARGHLGARLLGSAPRAGGRAGPDGPRVAPPPGMRSSIWRRLSSAGTTAQLRRTAAARSSSASSPGGSSPGT